MLRARLSAGSVPTRCLGSNFLRYNSFQSQRLLSTTCHRLAGFNRNNHYNQYNKYRQNNYSQSVRSSPFYKNWLVILGVFGLAGFASWWAYWPHHTFTPTVAKILRKALWAESEKGKHDYLTALKYYHEALELARAEKLESWSDEFTGIQLKICEMYERLNMNNDAYMIYSEIASCYLDCLTTPGKIPDELKPHLIQKDLRVVIKMVELIKSESSHSKAILLTHLLVAQQEVGRRGKLGARLMQEENDFLRGRDREKQKLYPNFNNDVANDSTTVNSTNKTGSIEKSTKEWEPFRDEFFNARDLYVALCVVTGDIGTAVRAKSVTLKWMLHADCEPGEILMSQTNLGSLMYLQAEEFEAKEISCMKANTAEKEVKENKELKEQCIQLATNCYESVLAFSKELPAKLRQESTIDKSIALATYGLGIINLHLGKLETAKNLFRESRVRAKGSGFIDLVVEAERELDRMQKEFDRLEKEGKIPDSINNEADRIKALLDRVENSPDIELDVRVKKR